MITRTACWLLVVLVALATSASAAGRRTAVPSTEQLEAWLAERPGSDALLHVLVGRYADAGDAARALERAEQALRRRPDAAESFNSLGVALASAGDAQQARAAFRRAIRRNPRMVQPFLNLGSVSMENAEFQKAVNDYDLATVVDPGSVEAWLGLGSALSQLGYLGQAKDAYDRVIALRPRSPIGYRAVGELYADQGRPADARPHLRRAYALGDRSDRLYALLCLAHADQPRDDRDVRMAIQFGERARAMGNNTSQVLFGMGLARQRAGQYALAIEEFRALLAQRSAAHGAWVCISQCYRAMGRPREAEHAALTAQTIITQRQRIEHLQYQIRQYPHRLELRRRLAGYLMETKNFLMAADHYSYLARQLPAEPSYWLLTARALRAGGALEQAAEMEKRAREAAGRPEPTRAARS